MKKTVNMSRNVKLGSGPRESDNNNKTRTANTAGLGGASGKKKGKAEKGGNEDDMEEDEKND